MSDNELDLARAELAAFKAQVRKVAIEAAKSNSFCDPGLNDVLEELGLPPKQGPFSVPIRYSNTRSTSRVVEVAMRDLSDADRAILNAFFTPERMKNLLGMDPNAAVTFSDSRTAYMHWQTRVGTLHMEDLVVSVDDVESQEEADAYVRDHPDWVRDQFGFTQGELDSYELRERKTDPELIEAGDVDTFHYTDGEQPCDDNHGYQYCSRVKDHGGTKHWYSYGNMGDVLTVWPVVEESAPARNLEALERVAARSKRRARPEPVSNPY